MSAAPSVKHQARARFNSMPGIAKMAGGGSVEPSFDEMLAPRSAKVAKFLRDRGDSFAALLKAVKLRYLPRMVLNEHLDQRNQPISDIADLSRGQYNKPTDPGARMRFIEPPVRSPMVSERFMGDGVHHFARRGVETYADGGAARHDAQRFRRAHLGRPESDEGRAAAREILSTGLGALGGAGIGAGLGRVAARYGSPYLADVATMLRFRRPASLERFGPLTLGRAARALPSSMAAETPAALAAGAAAEELMP